MIFSTYGSFQSRRWRMKIALKRLPGTSWEYTRLGRRAGTFRGCVNIVQPSQRYQRSRNNLVDTRLRRNFRYCTCSVLVYLLLPHLTTPICDAEWGQRLNWYGHHVSTWCNKNVRVNSRFIPISSSLTLYCII